MTIVKIFAYFNDERVNESFKHLTN